MNNPTLQPPHIQQKVAFFTSLCGLVGSLTLIPFVFQRYLAVADLLPSEVSGLWWTFALLSTVSLLLMLFRKKVNGRYIMLFLSILCFIGIEQLTRIWVHYTWDMESRAKLITSAYVTYPEMAAYQGHPFLAFTGRPKVALEGNEAIGQLQGFNTLGFQGADFKKEKPTGTVRIACLGGSTTASGYPAILESYLNANKVSDSLHFEVFNFGLTYWTTAHSMVNYLLNVQDYAPDYVVIHHAWNDEKVRNALPGTFRSDYSHAFKTFSHPAIPDKYPLRISLLYRLLQEEYGAIPGWKMLEPATTIVRKHTEPYYQGETELQPFERNIKTILDLAHLRGSKVVLTTQPHSTDQSKPFYYSCMAIDQGNTVMCSIWQEYKAQALFVDLDSSMSGHMNEVFKDLGHVNEVGKTVKAEQIGSAILADLEHARQDSATAANIIDQLPAQSNIISQ